MKHLRSLNITLFLILAVHFFANGQIKLPRLLSNNAILQRDVDFTLYGWASANEEVQVLFKDKSYHTTANGNGDWEIQLQAEDAGGPYRIDFLGKNTITLENIWFGDVYLCSGQSNMELPMGRLEDAYSEELVSANHPNIRQFIVPDKFDFNTECSDLEGGKWDAVTPETISEFSGVAYFFAKAIQQKPKVPVGIINAAVGGSPLASWLDTESLKDFSELYEEHLKWKNDDLIDSITNSEIKSIQSWYSMLDDKDIGMREHWYMPTNKKDAWNNIALPEEISAEIFKKQAGVVWFSKRVELSELPLERTSRLKLGRLVDVDQTYINGYNVGGTSYQYPPRTYDFQSNILKQGENEIVVRLINNGGQAGFVKDKPYQLILDKDTLQLNGQWKYKQGALLSDTPSQTFIKWKPSGLFNAMIAPLTRFKIKAVLWYQGESDTGNPELYSKTFPKLITSWRDKWRAPNLPFLYVQLSNFMEETTGPQESNWAELREVQRKVNNSLPRTGMVVTIDIGEWNDIHPLNKKTVGDRLALEARRIVYNEELISAGPQPKSAKLEGTKVIIAFEHVANGWKVLHGKPTGFVVSEDGINFYTAEAEILKNNLLKIHHPDIAQPKVVRYAWANNPKDANLYNMEMLPAVPFQITLN